MIFYGRMMRRGPTLRKQGIKDRSERAARVHLNGRSEFSSGSAGTFASVRCSIRSMEEFWMKRFGYIVAALGAIIFAAPSIADAQTVVIKRGGHHAGQHHPHHGARAHYRSHRGWHRGHRHGHRNKVVIIKKHRY
jgi:hypothetical protein